MHDSLIYKLLVEAAVQNIKLNVNTYINVFIYCHKFSTISVMTESILNYVLSYLKDELSKEQIDYLEAIVTHLIEQDQEPDQSHEFKENTYE